MIDTQFIPIEQITDADRSAMFALLDRHFVGVTAETFADDLADKTHALLLRRADELLGFSTVARYDALGEAIVCSGDTIMDPSGWGSAELPRQWIAGVRSLAPTDGRPLRWLLLTSGFRTYRLLSTFWRNFVPHQAGDDTTMLKLRDVLAAERYGRQFDGAAGVVRLLNPQRLRPHLAGIPPQRLRDPHVAHFAALNPGHADGDELVCLVNLTDDNLTRAGQRMVRE